jgi:formylglycine-generating enzyme required for sulfatase activity
MIVKSMQRALAATTLVVVASSCGVFDRGELPPEGQVVFGVATDAWLPRGAGEGYEPVSRNALFERLRIEMFAPGETEPCRECSRDFGVDHRTMNEGHATVGFVPRPGTSGYRIRVRLYHSGASESSAEPRPSSTLEAVVALPPVSADGVVDLHVTLRTDEMATPRGTLDAPASADPGPPPTGLAGTWHEDVVRGCAEPARAGEACVPGGAFWFGDPGFAVPYERLVALSPFYIAAHETTVAEMRASGLASGDALSKSDPFITNPDPTKEAHYCTYTTRAGSNEELPANCVTRDLARRYCEKQGGQLPTDAQFEFVAGARRDATYPWGEAIASCADAVFGRNYETKAPPESRECVSSGIGAAKPGSGRLDRLRLPDGNEVLDLAGNVAEWTADFYQLDDEPCRTGNPVIDPLCRERTAVSDKLVSVRGNSWAEPGGSALRAAVSETAAIGTPQNPRVGFRCVRASN